MELLNTSVWVDYGQFYVVAGVDPEYTILQLQYAGQHNGLCGAATGRSLFLITGLHTGPVPVVVESHAAEPAVSPDWEEVVEVRLQVGEGAELTLMEWGGQGYPLAISGPGSYRVRYCASGLDAGAAVDHLSSGGESAPDRYLVQFWPAPPAPAVPQGRASTPPRSSGRPALWPATGTNMHGHCRATTRRPRRIPRRRLAADRSIRVKLNGRLMAVPVGGRSVAEDRPTGTAVRAE